MTEPVDREVEVLVVGAGPTGLTLACELRRNGIECLLVDQDEGPTPLSESRALALHARTLEVFDRLGAADRMVAEGRPIHGLAVCRRGRRIAGFRLALEPEETRFPYVLSLPQGRAEQLLLQRLAELGGEAVWGTRLDSFKPDADGAAAVLTGPSGATSRVRARWLIGCDGARSVVRRGLGPRFEGGEYPERFLLADVRLDWSRPTDEGTGLLTPEGLVLAFPLSDDGWWRLIDATGADIEDPEAILARFRAILARETKEKGAAPARLVEARWISSFLIHRRIVDRYRAGRCFVVGDAAHLHSPVGGQGLNIGVQDAANLAWKLALVIRGEGREAILDSYDAERRPAARAVLRATDWATRLLTARNPLFREARNLLLRVLDGSETARRRLSEAASGLGVSCRKSPIVAEASPNWLQAFWRGGRASYQEGRAFDRGPRPGDRMPDPPLATTDPETGRDRRLSDVVFRPEPGVDIDRAVRHVLLVFRGAEPGSSTVRGAELVAEAFATPRFADRIRPILVEPMAKDSAGWTGERLADPDNVLHQRFGAAGACLYLIRPDGCIAFRGRPVDPSALWDYLELVFR